MSGDPLDIEDRSEDAEWMEWSCRAVLSVIFFFLKKTNSPFVYSPIFICKENVGSEFRRDIGWAAS